MTHTLDEGSSTPLYAQLRELLKSQIEDGSFAPGERIPSEDKLNGLYGVSRITIRRALQELADDGYLVKCPGKGTYVGERIPGMRRPAKIRAKFTQNNDVQSFTEACASNSQSAGAHLVSLEEVEGLEEERDFFGFGSEGRLLRLVRIRTADRTPIMIEENYFPVGTYGFLLDADYEDTSLYDIVVANGHGEPTLNEPCDLDLEKAPADMAPYLDVPAGEPLFCLAVDISIRMDRPCTWENNISWARATPFASKGARTDGVRIGAYVGGRPRTAAYAHIYRSHPNLLYTSKD